MRPASFQLLLCSTLLAACGTQVYRPASAADLRMDDPREIDDARIRAAFEARPQLAAPVRVAYYAFDDAHAEAVGRMLRGLQGVRTVYRIPSLLVTGRRRDEDPQPPWAEPPPPISMGQLRLAAARARCDVLLVLDYGYRIERSANGLVALNALILPTLFVPWLDADVRSHLDAYVIDTRNGYLYAQLRSNERHREPLMGPFSERDRARVESQWTALLARTRRQLVRTLEAESRSTAATGARHAPPTTPSAAPEPPAPDPG